MPKDPDGSSPAAGTQYKKVTVKGVVEFVPLKVGETNPPGGTFEQKSVPGKGKDSGTTDKQMVKVPSTPAAPKGPPPVTKAPSGPKPVKPNPTPPDSPDVIIRTPAPPGDTVQRGPEGVKTPGTTTTRGVRRVRSRSRVSSGGRSGGARRVTGARKQGTPGKTVRVAGTSQIVSPTLGVS